MTGVGASVSDDIQPSVTFAGTVPLPTPPPEPSLRCIALAAGARASAVPRIMTMRLLRFTRGFLSFRPSCAVDYPHDGAVVEKRFRGGDKAALMRFRASITRRAGHTAR